ncbi:MAG: malto-oligosyltrehalose trehalohydrolase [Bacteroidia bacterium]
MHERTGAIYQDQNRCKFRVWAPFRKSVELHIEGKNESRFAMEQDGQGYWERVLDDIPEGTKYSFRLDQELTRLDPASRDQSAGVHNASKTLNADYDWDDRDWQPMPLKNMIMYELHTGTFTPSGTFEAIIPRLDYILDLGVNTIELMPVCQFPGSRNWGYDGVYPYAVQDSYGGASGLKKLVNACHQKGLAVILDVVYNHLGPEGNYLNDFGPYFTDKYKTPWGAALNFDDAFSDHVRSYFINAALMWLREFHIDALRLDAVHAIFDNSARHILAEMREAADLLEQREHRPYYLIAESDLNDVKLLRSYHEGGCNLDAQWADDFHHSVHALATGERNGYYSDFGKIENLAKTFRQAFVYDGRYSGFRKRTIGSDPSGHPPEKFVVCIQNHDQVGNRMKGERLSHLVSFEMTKLCAGAMLISPFVPLLFMGEEYGEKHPFLYFVSHSDPVLVEAVRKGRQQEFASFEWKGEVPDPQATETFELSKLQWNFDGDKTQVTLREYYRHLITMRRNGHFENFASDHIETRIHENEMILELQAGVDQQNLAFFNFDQKTREVRLPSSGGNWQKVLASWDAEWLGPGGAPALAEANCRITLPPESLIIFINQ